MINPKKSLGQNFLTDKNIVSKIIKLSDINKNDSIIEIGPGTGNLTRKILAQEPRNLILIEKDRELANYLKMQFISQKKIKIFNEDVLKFELENIIKKNSIIIGNLPYNISSQILVKLIKFKKWMPSYKKLVLMFQKEVADKLLAKYKSRSYGRLTILANARLRIIDHFNVSETCFYPIPKVKSTVLIFEPITNQDFRIKDISNLEKITQTFFSKKRKMVNKGFRELFKNYSEVAKKINIDLNLRPNQLSEKDYYNITECFEKKNNFTN